MARGKLLHGLVHPEMGHIPMPRLPGDNFKGVCPFHGRCWEGLCSGQAIARRAGKPAEQLPPDHPAWDTTIQYMAHALVTLTCVLSPKRIIIGGSVRKAGQLGEEQLFQRVRVEFLKVLAGYIDSPALTKNGISQFIVLPKLGDNAGSAAQSGWHTKRWSSPQTTRVRRINIRKQPQMTANYPSGWRPSPCWRTPMLSRPRRHAALASRRDDGLRFGRSLATAGIHLQTGQRLRPCHRCAQPAGMAGQQRPHVVHWHGDKRDAH